MIVASHQPNFLPYMGYFYKMYMCDVFTLSDAVQFSRRGYHNYNFITAPNGTVSKITVPVNGHSGAINEIELSQWEHNRKKIWKRLCGEYCHAPYFNDLKCSFEGIFSSDFKLLSELNKELIETIHQLFGFDCKLVLESDLHLVGGTATEQIADICRKTDCGVYLSGTGAKEYLDEDYLKKNGLEVQWSAYEPLQGVNPSVFDYLMKHGPNVPDDWKKQKEVLLGG